MGKFKSSSNGRMSHLHSIFDAVVTSHFNVVTISDVGPCDYPHPKHLVTCYVGLVEYRYAPVVTPLSKYHRFERWWKAKLLLQTYHYLGKIACAEDEMFSAAFFNARYFDGHRVFKP